MKKKQLILELPNRPTPADIKEMWKEFEPRVKKLKKEGFRNTSERWWRSRYSDFLNIGMKYCPIKAEKDKKWDQLWKYYHQEMEKNEQIKTN